MPWYQVNIMFPENKLEKPKFQHLYQYEQVASQKKRQSKNIQIVKDGRWHIGLNLQTQMKNWQ